MGGPPRRRQKLAQQRPVLGGIHQPQLLAGLVQIGPELKPGKRQLDRRPVGRHAAGRRRPE